MALLILMAGGAIAALIRAGWIWAVLVALEVLFPRSKRIPFGARLKAVALGSVTWIATGVSAILTASFVQLAGLRPLFAMAFEPQTAGGRTLLAVAGTAFGVILYDFLYYWFHRLQHTRILWRFHAVHHAIEDLGAVNYAHWTEELSRAPFITIPIVLLAPNGLTTIAWVFTLVAIQSQYAHSQTRLNFGPFWRIVYDNRFHRIHHSLDPRHFEKNFGVLMPIWDWMFGTL